MNASSTVQRRTSARIPTNKGDFDLYFYENSADDKEHVALVTGQVSDQENVLVRVHSECFTGDVLGSLRCDCGEQLDRSLRLIADRGRGVLIYLRQEGRGIGLLDKLRAYNLQDIGYDTVDANVMLGHEPDERDYTIAAQVIEDLQVDSVQLLTNNPHKIESLRRLGVAITDRVPLEPSVQKHNQTYLATKAERMRHVLTLGCVNDATSSNNGKRPTPEITTSRSPKPTGRPYVTLSYAQSIDGSLAAARGEPLALSGPEALTMTHRLRAAHGAILVGIGTVLSDDPRLTVRRVSGSDPRPIIIDSDLRFPLDAQMLDEPSPAPWVITTQESSLKREKNLTALGVRVVRVPAQPNGHVDLKAALQRLDALGLERLMIEGGARIISSVLRHQLADHLVLTIASVMVGGLQAVNGLETENISSPVQLDTPSYRWCGEDLVVRGDFQWRNDTDA